MANGVLHPRTRFRVQFRVGRRGQAASRHLGNKACVRLDTASSVCPKPLGAIWTCFDG